MTEEQSYGWKKIQLHLEFYKTRTGAENAVDVFQSAGFRAEDISVLLPENLGSKDLKTEKSTKAPEGATAGATTGAVVGGTLGLLAGIGALRNTRAWDHSLLPVPLWRLYPVLARGA